MNKFQCDKCGKIYTSKKYSKECCENQRTNKKFGELVEMNEELSYIDSRIRCLKRDINDAEKDIEELETRKRYLETLKND